MIGNEFAPWEHLVVPVEKVLERIKPGASIFLGSAMAEPRTLIKSLLLSGQSNLQDLELIQVVCLGQDFSLSELKSHKFRLKTFYSGWAAGEAVRSGLMDLIPSRFSRIPYLIQSGRIPIEVAFIQISPPNPAGYASLGVAVDVTRQAMEQADLVVGEINPEVPVTFGDTFVPLSDFDLLTSGTEPLFHVPRWPLDKIFDRVAANVAALIEDGNCLNFSVGPLYEGLAKHLSRKRNLGIHSPFFTDALMDLVKSGAVTNRHKGVFRGKSLTTYAVGTPELMAWLNRNPLVEFQSLDKVWDPAQIGRNKRFIAVIPARKVGLGGRIALHFGMMNVLAGPSEVVDMVNGAEMSPGGLTVFALPSRNRKGESNIRLTVGDYPNIFGMRESIDVVATEYGTAFLGGRSLRERAQALIDIAHPDDRQGLVIQAKEHKILYQDQIFLSESAHLYPADMTTSHVFKGGVKVRIRAIKPSDEEEMRRLFYRFSDEAVYYRYFTPIKAMPHWRMQEYVNVDYRRFMSVVALVGAPGRGHIIAEARYVKSRDSSEADIAFVVDEAFQGLGIAGFLYKMLARRARHDGIKALTADVLASNKTMMKVFEKGGLPVQAKLEGGVYHLTIPFASGELESTD